MGIYGEGFRVGVYIQDTAGSRRVGKAVFERYFRESGFGKRE